MLKPPLLELMAAECRRLSISRIGPLLFSGFGPKSAACVFDADA